uniref:Uncharacterized protein n=1 Tax=Magallana gigas TaxID=29159 RepID=K1RRZ6_MAGGI
MTTIPRCNTTKMLDVIKGTPRYKKSKYPLAVNLAVLGMIFLRCVSVAYFVMGLVWKLHTGVIDESWISILNRLWIGHLRLGSTVNGLIGGSLATDFQNIYLQIARASYSYHYNDLKNSNQEWIAMFSTLGCCGITDRFITPGYVECHNYHYAFNFAEICWGKFAEAMGSYLTTFACFAAICFVIETVQLGIVDFLYSQMTNQRFPFALIRTLVSMVKKSALASDRMLIVANILRILSCISGLSLVVLGTMILTDTKLTGQEVKGIFVFIYILGVNFRNIIEGFGIAMIVLGSIAFVLNSLAIISDVIVPSKTKSKLITFLKVLMLIAEVTVLGIVVRFATQVNTDLRYKMANLLRNFNYLNRPWRIFFGELECCGVASSNDLCDMISGPTYCSNTLPYTCCHRSLYDTTESNLYNNGVCSSPNTILCIIFTILHTRRLNSQDSNDKAGDNFKDELEERFFTLRTNSKCLHVFTCKDAVLTRLDKYSNAFFAMSVLTIVCFIAQISLILYKLRKTELIPLINDKYVQAFKNLFKMEKGLRNIFAFEKKMIFPFITLIDENAPYQLTNMDRQYRNNYYYEIFKHLNRFYFVFDCCGADGPYEFSYLEHSDGYGGLTGSQPRVCCYGSSYLDDSTLLSSVQCEKKSCSSEFLNSIDRYSNAFFAIFSLTAVLEVLLIVLLGILFKYDEPFSSDIILKDMFVQERKKKKCDSNKENKNSMIQQKEKLNEGKEHSEQIKDKKSRIRENKVRHMDTEPESPMKSFSLASDFQGIYTSFVRLNQNSQTDVKNIKADWLQMFQLLGCCGITNNDGDSHCTSYISTRPCWEKFSDTMTTYCSSYLSLSGILFFLEIIQLSLCDLIYSQLSREKKLPFALAKTFISKIQFSWKTSRKTVLTNICRVLSSINAIVLIILGSVLLNDDQMTGEYISYQLQNETEIFLDRFRYNSNRQFAHLLTSEGALNNLFAKAECCGLAFSDGSELSLGGGEKIPIFCCKSNPLTEPSLLSNDNCTKGIDPSLRHRTVACNDAILTRLGYYDTSFFCFTSLTILCLISSVSMVVFGVLLKHDDKMTGDSVHNIYLFLYFRGANFNDIVEAMYLSLIVLGISSLVCCMLGLSDIFKPLRHTVKEKIACGGEFLSSVDYYSYGLIASMSTTALFENFPNELLSQSPVIYNFFSRLDDGYLMNEHGAWNNLFVKLKCCGYNYEEWEPISIHSSRINGDILVGMIKGREAKVTRYNRTGEEIENIQRDNKGQDMYGDPHYITENINGDVCTSDLNKHAVVVVNKSGQLRFSYTGQGSKFYPYGICTDLLGHIVICDSYTKINTVHLLDQDGQFLSFLLPERVKSVSVCVDNENNLHVGHYDTRKVKVYKYLQ